MVSRGVPYGLAMGTSPMAPRCMEVWRASVTRMEPAVVRYTLLVMSPAAPRYAASADAFKDGGEGDE